MRVPKTDSVKKDHMQTEGAVPASFDGSPSPVGPEHHSPGAQNETLPGKDPVDFGGVPRSGHMERHKVTPQKSKTAGLIPAPLE